MCIFKNGVSDVLFLKANYITLFLILSNKCAGNIIIINNKYCSYP